MKEVKEIQELLENVSEDIQAIKSNLELLTKIFENPSIKVVSEHKPINI